MAYIVIFYFFIGLFVNHRKTVAQICLLSPLIYNMGSVMGYSASFLLSILCLFSFAIKEHVLIRIKHIYFIIPVLVMFISLWISNQYGGHPHPSVLLQVIISYAPFVIFASYSSDGSESYLDYCLHLLYVVTCIIIFVSIAETVSRTNPLYDFLQKIELYDSTRLKTIEDVRFGLKRSQSLFSMHTSLGGYMYCVFAMFGILWNRYGLCLKRAILFLSFACIVIFLTGARSAIVSLLVCSIFFINKDFIHRIGIGRISVAIIALFVMSSYFMMVADSILNSNDASGSTTDMREMQFDIASFYWLQSPIYGNGINYTWEVVLPDNKELLGAESVWIPYMIDQGFIGCIAWFLFSIYAGIYCIRFGMKEYLYPIIGWVILNTLSSIPGVDNTFFLSCFLIALRYKQLKTIEL